MTPFVSWGLIIFLAVIIAVATVRVLRGTLTYAAHSPGRAIILEAVIGILPLTIYFGVLTSIPWNIVIPVFMWWIIAALLGVFAAAATYRLLPVRSSH
ncbi:hypothetical protein C3B44_06700 [Corynebacterium yudongzhengii]|uniref:Uncharacterized protein n=1 Tax=Corynebacterium yudongzhengii TaxID=2080740 RepID=A0A2U1T991_9CORY|nr:hypothetical protein [Corynebacterium yudongzhengii]AWB82080.1 hypothetical protein C3B44_06700 [Corynebacterium yudongzhengii]PWC02584.1 hypothetical protein DF222_01170 [Corynebacterium yudongzhengii]